MIKHIVAIILLTIAVILSMSYVQQGLLLLLAMHNWVASILTNVFSGGQAGNIIRQLLALLAIPVFIGLIPAFVYWLVKRSWFPYFMECVWVVWLLQIAALVIQHKAGA